MQKEMLLAVMKGSTVFVNYLGARIYAAVFCHTEYYLSCNVRFQPQCPRIPWLSRICSAHDVASGKQHKSVSASDVLKALELMEMGDLVPKLQAELQSENRIHGIYYPHCDP